jgi:hypothetical protein
MTANPDPAVLRALVAGQYIVIINVLPPIYIQPVCSDNLFTCCSLAVVDPKRDPPGSAFIWLPWIRIRNGNADPEHGNWQIYK